MMTTLGTILVIVLKVMLGITFVINILLVNAILKEEEMYTRPMKPSGLKNSENKKEKNHETTDEL